MKWIKHGDIQPSLKGSDHCPIYIDLHDELTLESGDIVQLRDVLHPAGAGHSPPRLAAINWEEFSGKQTLLSTFFGKKGEARSHLDRSLSPPEPREESAVQRSKDPIPQPEASLSSSQIPVASSPPNPSVDRGAVTSDLAIDKKRSLTQPATSSSSHDLPPSKKRKKSDNQQATLGAFFVKPKAAASASTSRSSEVVNSEDDSEYLDGLSAPTSSQSEEILSQLDADYRLACELSASQESEIVQSSASSSSDTKAAWTSLFTPIQPPKCTVHGEPAKKFTVNKQGPNKGRTFYTCARYVG